MAQQDGNNLNLRKTDDRNQSEVRKFTAASQVKVYDQTAPVEYNLSRTVSSFPDAAPATIAGTAWINMAGYMSLVGYPKFTGGTNPTMDITLWVPDRTNDNIIKVAEASGVSDFEEFAFNDLVRGRDVYLQVSATTGSPTSAVLYIARQ